ncbi:MAG: YraN family protein [Alphaproteobacteria bacterium]|nr:YraN family protein [Alphaproteobacteria bacterium]
MNGRRQRAERRGRLAEWRAAWRLRLAGYRILARRFRTRAGEIDLVARKGRLLAFVEVKARADRARAAEAVGEAQMRRIARAAELFMARHPRYAECSVRFDAVLVDGLWPEHIRDIWRPS